jgi:hypothetical protein
MTRNINRLIKFISLPVFVFLSVLTIFPATGHTWTSARLTSVDVTVSIASGGASEVTTQARFEVDGGEFHGFDLAELQGMQLDEGKCKAARDDGRLYNLGFSRRKGGRTQVMLAGGEHIKKGGITFALVHQVDFVSAAALRVYEGRARLDWTPFIWDQGLDVMRVQVVLPGDSLDAPVRVDPAVSRDYEVKVERRGALLTKYRPVRWYPMQVVLDFDPDLINGLGGAASGVESVDAPVTGLIGSVGAGADSPPPVTLALLPIAIVIIGFAFLLLKRFYLARLLGQLGFAARFYFLPATGMGLRVCLTLGAMALGLAAQHLGCLAAGVPALAAAAALWMTKRESLHTVHRSGGSWRQMDDEDIALYRGRAKSYRRARNSCFDITTIRGAVMFLFVLSGLAAAVLVSRGSNSEIAWASLMDGLLFAIPVWFSNVRAELPVDPTFEGFWTLRKWRRSLTRLAGEAKAGSQAAFWVREDDQGPIEVRLRVEPPPPGLMGIEVAGEVVLAGAVYKTRTAVILRAEPGTEAARRLAACDHAVEHHLTPDLEEEVIVLRDRRGRSAGLSPLRAALARLSVPTN